MGRDSRTGQFRAATPIEHGPAGIRNEQGELIGQVWSTPYGWFAAPRDSEITTIPCVDRADAIATVRRLA